MKNYIQEGDVLTLTAPAGGVSSGHIFITSTMFAVATADAAAGDNVEGVVASKVFEFDKAVADAPSQGDSAYWDNTNKVVTTVSAGNTLVGVFVKDYANGDTVAQVRTKAQ